MRNEQNTKFCDLSLKEVREFIEGIINNHKENDFVNTFEALEILKLKNRRRLDYLVQKGIISPKRKQGYKTNFYSKRELLRCLHGKKI